MVKIPIIGKCLTVGIILLFIGTNVIPSSGQRSDEKSSQPTSADKIIYVDANNTEGPWDGTLEHPFQCISDAIEVVENNDTIYIFNGQYPESFDFDFEDPICFHMIGENKETTTINGIIEFSYCPITLQLSNLSLYGVNIGTKTGNNHTIKNCIIISGGCIFLEAACYTHIINNVFINSSLVLAHGKENTIMGNSFTRKGIVISTGDQTYYPLWSTYHIENNTIGGKAIRFYSYQSNIIVPSDTGQLYLVSCQGFQIADLIISDVEMGIALYNCSQTVIRNCSISNASSSIYSHYSPTAIICRYSNQTMIINTNVENFRGGFIFYAHVDDTVLENCTVRSCYVGIEMWGGSHSRFSHCIIERNEYCFWLSSSINSKIEDCTFIQNRDNLRLDEEFRIDVVRNDFLENEGDPSIYNTYLTHWSHNFWDHARTMPKIIVGELVYYPYFLPPIILPIIKIDWFPATSPNNDRSI
jgi:parallel beta-helix repeat protein